MKPKQLILLAAGILFFGILNVVFHEWADYQIGLIFAKHYGVNFHEGSEKYPNYIVLSSLYGGPKGFHILFQWIIVMGVAGYSTTKLLIDKFIFNTFKKSTLILVIVLWLLKVPLPFHLSTLPGTYAALFVW